MNLFSAKPSDPSEDSLVRSAEESRNRSLELLKDAKALVSEKEAETREFESRLGEVNIGLVAREKVLYIFTQFFPPYVNNRFSDSQ